MSRRDTRCSLSDQAHHLRAGGEVIDPTELLKAPPALAVDQHQRRRALHLVGAHGRGDGVAVDGAVHADGMGYAKLVQEHLQRARLPC